MARYREVERKYDAEPDTALPDLGEVDGVATVTEPVEIGLEATYFDTPDVRLVRHRTTLRRRTGGDDEGWHLKLPAGADERTEVRLPLDGGTVVPEPLTAEVRALVRGADLAPVAILRTTRLERHLRADDGTDLAAVADDTVHAQRLGGDAAELSTWREVEVELVDGEPALLDAVDDVLRSAGMVRSPWASKLQRVLGEAGPAAAEQPTTRSSAGEALLAHVRAQVAELISRDRAVRAADPVAVHKMRVATRRLRSALATYRPLLDRAVTDPVRDELRWLGTELGRLRDVDVLHTRVRELAVGQPPELLLGPVLRRIDLEFADRRRTAYSELLVALDDPRYFRLLDVLEAFLDRPPFTARAHRRADRELPRLVHRAVRRVDRAAQAAADAPNPEARDVRLHEVRKTAKRARYAAESVEPVIGKPAKRLAKRMEAVQQTLGEHQDSVVTRGVLRELGVAAHLGGENGFTFGLLHGLEAAHAERAEAAYGPALRAAGKKRVRRWTT